MSVFTIARLTFREASRRWTLWVALLLGGIFLAVFGLAYSSMQQDLQRNTSPVSRLMVSEMYNFFLMGGLYVVNFLCVLMTVLTSVDTLSGEIASGTIHTIVSKPIRRWEVVAGKWLGFSAMLSLYLLLMAGGVMAVVYALSGYTAPNALRGLGLLWLNILLLLGVTLWGGTVFSTLTNGVIVFGLYGVAFLGGWIEQFAWLMSRVNATLNVQPAISLGILCSLILPSEALWRRAAYEMQSPVVSALGGFSFFTSGSAPSVWMVAYAILYTGAVFLLAMRSFSKRDL